MYKKVNQLIGLSLLIFGTIQLSAQNTNEKVKESILKVEFCDNSNICSVEDVSLLQEVIGKLPSPKTNPEFEGGVEALRKYFAINSLTDEKAKDLFFRVTIAFVVNCEGKAGNFQIISRGKGDLETFANQVLEIVNNMPQNWIPAQRKGKAVDCYQVLSFSIKEGKLDNVSYK
ncbi:hypothetical protein LJC68_10335 [Bacteroidales bacterium OttesenSCG-928-B11]|nr:hypothetical protein [Bacteroidales bacterium OttesenSCG-928-C03]MDL2313259.1 hypothetical protein [Bacteroidales bacterium OttesenSCG-928-B11]